jgi:hypothetical protein
MKKYAIQTGYKDYFPTIPEFKGDIEILAPNNKIAHFVAKQMNCNIYALCEIVEEITAEDLEGQLGEMVNGFNPKLN